MSRGNNFNVKLIFSKDPLAEVKLEQVFQYVLNINNQKPNEEQNTILEENQGLKSSELLETQKTQALS